MTLCLLVIYFQHFIEDSLLTLLKNEAVSLFVMSVTSNQYTWYQKTEILKSHISKVLSNRFPQWAHGYWQHMYIEGNTLTYKDHSTFKTFTIRCLGPDLGVTERFPAFARTQW